MNLAEIRSNLAGKYVSNIMICGFIDPDDEVRQFTPLWGTVYFELDRGLLAAVAIPGVGRLQLRLVEGLDHRAATEEGFVPAFMSLGTQHLPDSESPNPIRSLFLWNPQAEEGQILCDAMSVAWKNSTTELFVDPSYHFGIRLGGQEQRRVWDENWPKALGRRLIEIPILGHS